MGELARTVEVIEEGVAAGLHTGAQVYVSYDGNVVADMGVGALTPDAAVPWRSATKAVTTAAAGRLWQHALFALDDRVADYVPGFEAGGKGGVTIRHLLTHTGGFRFGDELEDGWVPGRKAGYHPRTGFDALSAVLHQVDGRPFETLASEEVLAPAGMTGVTFDGDGDGGASAGLVGPIRALGRLYELLLSGGASILSPVTVEALTARHRTGMFDHTFGAVVDMGLGFILDSKLHGRPDVPYGYGPHASSRTFGHGGQQSSTGFADPVHRLAVAVAFDAMPGEKPHQQRMFETLAALYEDLGLG